MREWLVWNGIGVGSVISFFLWEQTLPLELWYLLSVPLAGMAIAALWQIQSAVSNGVDDNDQGEKKANFRRKVVASLWIASAVMIVGGLSFDAPLCFWLSTKHYVSFWLLDSWMLSTVTFAACDLAFYGLWLQLQMFPDANTKVK